MLIVAEVASRSRNRKASGDKKKCLVARSFFWGIETTGAVEKAVC